MVLNLLKPNFPQTTEPLPKAEKRHSQENKMLIAHASANRILEFIDDIVEAGFEHIEHKQLIANLVGRANQLNLDLGDVGEGVIDQVHVTTLQRTVYDMSKMAFEISRMHPDSVTSSELFEAYNTPLRAFRSQVVNIANALENGYQKALPK